MQLRGVLQVTKNNKISLFPCPQSWGQLLQALQPDSFQSLSHASRQCWITIPPNTSPNRRKRLGDYILTLNHQEVVIDIQFKKYSYTQARGVALHLITIERV